MKRDEFNAYAANLRAKTQEFKNLKQDLADVRQETVVLANTERVSLLVPLPAFRARCSSWNMVNVAGVEIPGRRFR
jgi:hypothetical protein